MSLDSGKIKPEVADCSTQTFADLRDSVEKEEKSLFRGEPNVELKKMAVFPAI